MELVVHTSLVLGLLVVYSLLGAIIFQLLEGGGTTAPLSDADGINDTSAETAAAAAAVELPLSDEEFNKFREDFIKSVVTAAKSVAEPKESKSKPDAKDAKDAKAKAPPALGGLASLKAKLPDMLRAEFKKYESSVRAALTDDESSSTAESTAEPEDQQESGDDVDHWDFMGSLFYCTTIYTTIGYGSFSPVTDAGRIFTIIYAIIGIPLCLIALDGLGKLMTHGLKKLWSVVFRSYPVDDEFNFLAPVALAITLLYILAGADMYRQWEDWDYVESVYFIFITISTVGFGDVLPDCPGLFLLSYLYVLIGLALAGMTINVMMETVGKWIYLLQQRILPPKGPKQKVQ